MHNSHVQQCTTKSPLVATFHGTIPKKRCTKHCRTGDFSRAAQLLFRHFSQISRKDQITTENVQWMNLNFSHSQYGVAHFALGEMRSVQPRRKHFSIPKIATTITDHSAAG